MKLATSAAALVLAAVLAACADTPVTGRKQLMLVSEDQAISASAQAYQEVLKQEGGKVNTDPALKTRVEAITGRLVAQAIKYRPETADWKWQVVVIDEPQTLNAWAMAGGKMAIYTGIVDKLRLSDDEIAQIMGHEIGHALAKHTAERMSVATAQQLGLELAGQIFGTGSVTSQLALQGAALATTVGVQLPNSRQQESEADRIGIELAARAGYDPNAAVALWQKMIQATGQTGKSDWLSTHPAGERRIEALSALVPQMMPYYQDKSPRPVYKLTARTLPFFAALIDSAGPVSPTGANKRLQEPSTEPVENCVHNLRAMPPKARAAGPALPPPKLYAAVNRLAETTS